MLSIEEERYKREIFSQNGQLLESEFFDISLLREELDELISKSENKEILLKILRGAFAKIKTRIIEFTEV